MRSKYKYIISIEINDNLPEETIFIGKSNYPGGGTLTDDIHIKNNKITLECYRVGEIKLDGIFDNYQSGLYGQIAKSILYYICIKQAAPSINKIEMLAEYKSEKQQSKTINSSDFKFHPALLPFQHATFSPTSLEILFGETERSSSILKSISHLIRSKTKNDIFDRFDSLWKSYNALYRTIASKSKDHDCHKDLRSFILAKPIASTNAAALIANLTSKELREKIRWRALILNDYESINLTKSFHDFILRYNDPKLMAVFEEILPYREKFLQTQNLLQPVKNHIAKNIQKDITNNQEIVAIICIKYMYFVRNKSAHGERLDRIIGLSNKEAKEIKWLSSILETLIIDLINAHTLFPQPQKY